MYPTETKHIYKVLDLIANEIGIDETAAICDAWKRERQGRGYERKEFSRSQVATAYKLQRGSCPYCEDRLTDPRFNNTVEPAMQTVGDHWKPCKTGGKNDDRNIRAVHAKCNGRKGAIDPETDAVDLAKRLGCTVLDILKRAHQEA